MVQSWLFFGIVFAQAYAHADQLARRAGTPALIYPGSHAPDYWDCVYLSLTLSMTFQTSDVSIAEPRQRQVGTRRVSVDNTMRAPGWLLLFDFGYRVVAIPIGRNGSIAPVREHWGCRPRQSQQRCASPTSPAIWLMRDLGL